MRPRFPRLTSIAAMLFAAAAAAPAVAASDSCSGAQLIGVGSQWGATFASTNDGSSSCGSSNSTPDVWYAFTAPASGTLSLSTCDYANFDTVLSVHTGCPGTTSNEVACNDDSCGTRSALTVNVVGGLTYRIRVSGYNGATGYFRLDVGFVQTPHSNSCAGGVGIGEGTYYGTTAGAGADPTPGCYGATTPDVWYWYTAPFTGTLHLDTCGSGFDTVLSVHNGCGAAAQMLACNDDYCGVGSGLSLPVTSGTLYRIRITGFASQTGPYVLNVRLNPNAADPCGGGAVIRTGTYTGTNVGATSDGVENCNGSGADVWYHYIAPANGYLLLDTCGSELDTVLSVHSACGGGIGSMIACNDDAIEGPCPGMIFSHLRVPVTGGTRYRIRVVGFSGSQSSFNLNVGFVAAGADGCTEAPFITDGVHRGSTALATAGNYSPCGSGGSPDVWYAYFATASGTLNLSLCGSTYDTVLSVHSDCTNAPGTTIACNDDSAECGLQSRLSIPVTAGTPYRIRVSGFSASGDYMLTVGLSGCAADWNNDGAVNSNDISAFLSSWLASVQQGNLVADFNGDGAVNSNDISAFLSAWLLAVQTGC